MCRDTLKGEIEIGSFTRNGVICECIVDFAWRAKQHY